MMRFLDAEQILSDLRKGQSLTNKIYYLSFDSQKTSQNGLAELKSRCARLGYSFNSVEFNLSYKNNSPSLFYLVKNMPSYPVRQLKEALFDEAIA